MNRIFNWSMTACLAALALAACTQDELGQGEPLPPGKYPLELTSCGLQAVATPAQAPTRGTVDNDWDGVTEVAVQVGNEVKKYTVTPDDDEKESAKLTSGNPFYWQSATEPIDITAWYPYSDGYPDNWLVEADQSTANGYQASDLIKGELKGLTFANRDREMSFEHQTAKVVVKLTATEGFVLDKTTSVQLMNVGGVKDGGKAIKTYRHDDAEQTYFAMLGEQTITANVSFIKVTANRTDFYYKPDANKELKAGYVYTYNINVKAEGLDVKVSESIGWGKDGATGAGSVTLP